MLAIQQPSWLLVALRCHLQPMHLLLPLQPTILTLLLPLHLWQRHRLLSLDECFWIVKGTFLIKVAGRFMTVSEGAWIFVPRGTAHAFRNVGTEEGQMLIEALPAGGMRQYFEEVGAVLLSEPVDQQALHRVDERYGIIAVGPPLQGETA